MLNLRTETGWELPHLNLKGDAILARGQETGRQTDRQITTEMSKAYCDEMFTKMGQLKS